MAFRRGPNISQFLRDLHENPTLLDNDPAFTMDDQDLSMFTNTEFFDLETGQNTDFQPPAQPPTKPDVESLSTPPAASSSDPPSSTAAVSPVVADDHAMTAMTDFANLDFIGSGEFNFPGFDTSYSSSAITPYQENLGNLHQQQPSHIQSGPQPLYPPNGSVAQHLPPRHNSFGTTPRIAAADKRSPDALNPQTRALSFDDQTRVAAEEDKRRRNTAASARFRVKKKQREQALEKSAKEMAEKVSALDNRIQQLETENKWLKSIVLEKHSGDESFLGKLLDEFKAKHPNSAKMEAAEAEAEVEAAVSDEESLTRNSSG